MGKRQTTVVNGHSHTYDDDIQPGETRVTSENDGHTHRYVANDEGEITILEADDHVHQPTAETSENSIFPEVRSKSMQSAVIPFEVKSIQEEDNFFRVKGLGSTFGNVDFGGDIVIRGAFRESLEELKRKARPVPDAPHLKRLIPMLWQHNMEEPIGSFVLGEETNEGLELEAILPKSDTFVSGRVIPQMRAGSVGEMSIGFITEKARFNDDGNRELIKVKLIETSLVTMAMNPKALVTDMKGATKFHNLPLASRDRDWDATAAIGRVRNFLDSEEAPGKSYRRAFLWFDEENSEDFGAYKLPIADVIDGQLVAVPRAIFAAAAALRGARGGVNIPDSDRAAVIQHVNRYYDKMDLESPFTEQRAFRVDDIDVLDEKTLETVLNRGIVLSRKNAKRVVAALRMVKREADQPIERDAETLAELVASMKSLTESLTTEKV